jgi:hypothetical protein
MNEVRVLWEHGAIRPIKHITTFDISKLEVAMSYFAKGVHTGKLVITYQNPDSRLKVCSVLDTHK